MPEPTEYIICDLQRDQVDDDAPEILVPAPAGFSHGQLLMAVPGIFFNFVADSEEDLAEMAREAALAQAESRGLAFRSPHDGRIHYLTPAGAQQIMLVGAARTQGAVAPRSKNSRIVRVD